MIMQRFLYRLLRSTALLGLLAVISVGPAQAREQTLLVLGDSISAAYGMSLEDGWVAHLASELRQRHPDYQVVNASISGETTGGALRRLPALLAEFKPGLVLIELGGNDGLRGFPIKSLRQNLTTLAQRSQQAGAEVLFLPMEIPPNYGKRYAGGFRESYSVVATQTSSTLTPFILDGIATRPELMQEDGIHPRPEAQQMMLDNVLPTILETLQ